MVDIVKIRVLVDLFWINSKTDQASIIVMFLLSIKTTTRDVMSVCNVVLARIKRSYLDN